MEVLKGLDPSNNYEKQLRKLANKYSLLSYSKLRSVLEYKSGRFENSTKLRASFLEHSSSSIPRSITVFHDPTSKSFPAFKRSSLYNTLKYEALLLFEKISCIAGENVYTDPFPLPKQIFVSCNIQPKLRDELFAQLIKQTTYCFEEKVCLIYWKLIYLSLLSTSPSDEMGLIILSHSAAIAQPCGFADLITIEGIAKNCFNILINTLQGKRSHLSLSNKYIWEVLKPSRPKFLTVYGFDCTQVELELFGKYSVGRVVKKACEFFELSSPEKWSLVGVLYKDKFDSKGRFNSSYRSRVYKELSMWVSERDMPLVQFVALFGEVGRRNCRVHLRRSAPVTKEEMEGLSTFELRLIFYSNLYYFSIFPINVTKDEKGADTGSDKVEFKASVEPDSDLPPVIIDGGTADATPSFKGNAGSGEDEKEIFENSEASVADVEEVLGTALFCLTYGKEVRLEEAKKILLRFTPMQLIDKNRTGVSLSDTDVGTLDSLDNSEESSTSEVDMFLIGCLNKYNKVRKEYATLRSKKLKEVENDSKIVSREEINLIAKGVFFEFLRDAYIRGLNRMAKLELFCANTIKSRISVTQFKDGRKKGKVRYYEFAFILKNRVKLIRLEGKDSFRFWLREVCEIKDENGFFKIKSEKFTVCSCVYGETAFSVAIRNALSEK